MAIKGDMCDKDYYDWVNYSHSTAALQVVAEKFSGKPSSMSMIRSQNYTAGPDGIIPNDASQEQPSIESAEA